MTHSRRSSSVARTIFAWSWPRHRRPATVRPQRAFASSSDPHRPWRRPPPPHSRLRLPPDVSSRCTRRHPRSSDRPSSLVDGVDGIPVSIPPPPSPSPSFCPSSWERTRTRTRTVPAGSTAAPPPRRRSRRRRRAARVVWISQNLLCFGRSVAANIDLYVISELRYFFLQLRIGPTDFLMVVPRNDAMFPKLHREEINRFWKV